jgi:DNA (cytosine-5)-methyltransferase 1
MDTQEKSKGTQAPIYATDTDSTSAQCRNCEATKGWKDQGRRIEPFGFDMEWKKFPTQSPVCGGDDGLPTELDGITFPKWRNESIKGYGNAIVPQIAYELFKIIEHENKNQSTTAQQQDNISSK